MQNFKQNLQKIVFNKEEEKTKFQNSFYFHHHSVFFQKLEKQQKRSCTRRSLPWGGKLKISLSLLAFGLSFWCMGRFTLAASADTNSSSSFCQNTQVAAMDPTRNQLNDHILRNTKKQSFSSPTKKAKNQNHYLGIGSAFVAQDRLSLVQETNPKDKEEKEKLKTLLEELDQLTPNTDELEKCVKSLADKILTEIWESDNFQPNIITAKHQKGQNIEFTFFRNDQQNSWQSYSGITVNFVDQAPWALSRKNFPKMFSPPQRQTLNQARAQRIQNIVDAMHHLNFHLQSREVQEINIKKMQENAEKLLKIYDQFDIIKKDKSQQPKLIITNFIPTVQAYISPPFSGIGHVSLGLEKESFFIGLGKPYFVRFPRTSGRLGLLGGAHIGVCSSHRPEFAYRGLAAGVFLGVGLGFKKKTT